MINTDMGVPLNLPSHVALVGLPGSGKSTVGRQLARRLGWAFLDTDQIIEKRIGLPIREFFETEGEAPFRDLEQAVVEELTRGEPCVLSTGGGAVLRPVNREHLKRRTYAVYLHSSPEDVFRRLRHDQNRPLLQVADPLARLRDLYSVRDPLYRESARFVIETGRPSASALIHLIVHQLEISGLVPGPGN
jgi:shikimate kinase